MSSSHNSDPQSYKISRQSLDNFSRNPGHKQTDKQAETGKDIASLPELITIHHPSTGKAVVTCEIKLFQNYISLLRRPSEIILF